MKGLSKLLPNSYIVSPRASSSIYILFKYLAENKPHGEIIMPNIVCPTVPLMALFSGLTPVFCEVCNKSLIAEAEHLQPKISDKTVALLSVSLFGKIPDMMKLVELTKANDIYLIEDLAQSAGGKYKGQDIGHFGDFSVLSLNNKKIIPGRGGVLYSKDPKHILGLKYIEEKLNTFIWPKDVDVFNRYIRGMRKDIDAHIVVEKLNPNNIDCFFDLFVGRCERQNKLAIEKLVIDFYNSADQARKFRFKNYRKYMELGQELGFVNFNESEMIWRLPLILPNEKFSKDIVPELRSRGHLVSDHYWPVSLFFNSCSVEASLELKDQILNFPVDEQFDFDKLSALSEILKNFVA